MTSLAIRIALIVVGGGTWAISADIPSVQVVRPSQPEPVSAIRLPARTAPAEEVEIFSRVTGIVGERRVDIGDRVTAGDILAIIEAPEIQRAAERASAGVAQANARSELARSALERARSMSKNRVIAEEALDEKESAAKTAAADLLAAQAELNRVEELKRFQTIRAPFDGTISSRTINRGDHIEGDNSQSGRGLFHLVRLNELRVELDAPPAAALRLKPGQSASVEFSELPAQKFPAVVSRASSVIDTASGTMRVELHLPNPDQRIPAGLNGTAVIEVSAAPGLLQLPTNAILVRDGKNQVAAVRDGKVAFQPVQLGKNLGQKIEVLSGISADESLIVSPNSLLREGDPVQAQ